MTNIDFKAQAEALRDELIAWRRDFHQHPELAFQEFRTAGIVAEELSKLGMEVQTGVGKTGVVGILEGSKEGPTILYRADMDALPINELNETEYVSTEAGKMHACGHDGHTTIALGVAKLLTQYRDQISGRVKFVFQPAEEIAAGAKAMIADGILQNPRPEVTLGLHLWNTAPVGRVMVADGPIMAGSGSFKITLTGKGGHGALPDETIDPIVCASQLVLGFQTIVSRNASPLERAVVSVTFLHSGDAYNVIPQTAELGGTIRYFTHEVRDLIDRRMREITAGISTAMGCTFEIEIRHETEPVTNNPEVGERVRNAFKDYVPEGQLELNERTMGAEDVGFMMADIPGMYMLLGSGNSERGLDYGHHHPRFDFDEEVLTLGVTLMSAALADYVLPE